MKKIIPLLLLFAAASGPVHAAEDTNFTGNINGILGFKSLDNDDWDPVDKQGLIGFQSDIRGRTWPISLALDVLGTSATEEKAGADITGSTFELGIGVRKVWDGPGATVVPYLGGGPLFLHATEESESDSAGGTLKFDDDDGSIGVWAGGGVFFHLSRLLNVGLGLRYSTADVTLFSQKKDAGGLQFVFLTGVHF